MTFFLSQNNRPAMFYLLELLLSSAVSYNECNCKPQFIHYKLRIHSHYSVILCVYVHARVCVLRVVLLEKSLCLKFIIITMKTYKISASSPTSPTMARRTLRGEWNWSQFRWSINSTCFALLQTYKQTNTGWKLSQLKTLKNVCLYLYRGWRGEHFSKQSQPETFLCGIISEQFLLDGRRLPNPKNQNASVYSHQTKGVN